MDKKCSDLLELKRWNTPTIYNGWEKITTSNPAKCGFNLEECKDFMPQMGPMVGYAVTVVVEPGNSVHARKKKAWSEYRKYIGSVPGPKIVVVQDLDKPNVYGAFWGEVNSNIHKALGCVGTIADGAIRDVDEICNSGFKAIARRLCVGHAFSTPVKWDCKVEVFGTKVRPGQLIHADKHGFLVVSKEEVNKLVEATRFMDSCECKTVIPAARSSSGRRIEEILETIDLAANRFNELVRKEFGSKGEW